MLGVTRYQVNAGEVLMMGVIESGLIEECHLLVFKIFGPVTILALAMRDVRINLSCLSLNLAMGE